MNAGSKQNVVSYLLLALFVLIAVLLLNQNCVYTPDSAEYIILAEAFFSGQGFRDLSEPARPLHVKHPFMYPLLLALPVGLFPSYPILAAKAFGIVPAMAGCFCSSIEANYEYLL